MKKRIAILGSTGSIGTQALEVIHKHPDAFSLEVISAMNNAHLLVDQARKYKPDTVIIANENLYNRVKEELANEPIKIFAGKESLSQIVESDSIDIVLNAIVGFAGLLPTISSIKAGKRVALANKEALVVGGQLIRESISVHPAAHIIPVDSEHSAIFQCLAGEGNNALEKIILTASGGPFRGKSADFLKKVKKEQALRHPNWDMGCKITIDSASLMNKGLEVIEASWLFDIPADRIEVVIHPQSIIHSMVQFEDGSIKAQLGLPDMRLPIQYAFTYPDRFSSDFPRFNFVNYPKLTFETPDLKNFRNLALAFEALEKGGNSPCILNAANEIAVSSFLKERIGFQQMSALIEHCMQQISFIKSPGLEDLLETDKETRMKAKEFISNHSFGS
ncbi:MAG: 1-deoxy-D-xylulose-5-phosphate reductoisomerase [Bacteroidales bacterium]|nr:1-deoxy-D-xylulose-5-phosphate reductoisomerase [Bacteroidales bacterium]MCF8345090.1 1-deoxy-D-xylulose-5-phosphate reductoisomerase [Bacteroidales bacterium]MCF8351566.1 1-deoxy-D-xylulose-5-phosphate reductoisomerase [Bacteroidales bacterium]MCF8376456.1 1-deoxy-D-xylulose-5-phosphate reductoisomerase [Bacteroidales bacterium]MCF8400575.1 1-deoxy-D-xylulose-5-phosphate reductoisomerase [Bacteroidales bacterium]